MIITNELLREYKNYLLNKEFATNTIQNYTTDTNLFLNFIKNKNGLGIVRENEITMKEIESYKMYLREIKTPKTSIYYTKQPTISPQTIQTKLIAIKSFLKFLNTIYNTWLDYKKIETKKYNTNYIETITEQEFKTLFNYIWEKEKYRINALRSQLFINIWYTSGLRISEILSLKVNDIENSQARITWKGNKTRRVFFTKSTKALLTEYLHERELPIPRTWIKENRTNNVFISHNSWYDYWKLIRKETYCAIIKKYSDEMNEQGIIDKRITAHCLRHSYATRLLEAWLNIREIQELLGHSDIQTTERYCHVLESNLKQKVNEIFE